MKLPSLTKLSSMLGLIAALALPAIANAGAIFLTGHDPDFHAQPGAGLGKNLLAAGLSFVTGGTYNDHNAATKKFLWVESTISVPGGHLRGENSLDDVGVNSTDYDRVDGAGFASVNLANYSAIALASTFGGTLARAELQALFDRKADIETFINGGGGLFASAQCYPCGANLAGGTDLLYAFLPITVTSVGASPRFTLTAYGSSLGLVDGDMQDPTHNSFGATGGLNVVDFDTASNATTLAGIVTINNGTFNPAPAPGTAALAGLALAVLARSRRRR